VGERLQRVRQVAHGRQPRWRQQRLLRIVQDDEDRFITAKGGEEALIDLRVGALAGQQAVAGRIDPKPGDATQRPARHPHQEQDHPPSPAEQRRGKPFHGGLQGASGVVEAGRDAGTRSSPRRRRALSGCGGERFTPAWRVYGQTEAPPPPAGGGARRQTRAVRSAHRVPRRGEALNGGGTGGSVLSPCARGVRAACDAWCGTLLPEVAPHMPKADTDV